MSETLPPWPAPIPPPDRHQIERLNATYDLTFSSRQPGWRGRLTNVAIGLVNRILGRQRVFNALVVDHINRNDRVGIEAHHASARAMEWLGNVASELRADCRKVELPWATHGFDVHPFGPGGQVTGRVIARFLNRVAPRSPVAAQAAGQATHGERLAGVGAAQRDPMRREPAEHVDQQRHRRHDEDVRQHEQQNSLHAHIISCVI